MANPQILINNNGTTFPIYASTSSSSQIGTLMKKELFVANNSTYYGTSFTTHAYTPSGWKKSHINLREYGAGGAYSQQYAMWSINSSRHVFNVRRKCRIFRGKTEITSIGSGDLISTDGRSTSGLEHPYRLSINGYKKGSNSWVQDTGGDLWCDTDIEIGYSSSPTVYSTKW